MKNHRTYLRIEMLITACVIALLAIPIISQKRSSTAEACWSYLRIECFERNAPEWPWCQPTPQRCWRFSPNHADPNAWGIQDQVYSVRLQSLSSNDLHSLWCMGEPGTDDPRFDVYPGNLSTFVTYGPLDLTNQAYAQVQFSLFFRNAMDVQDTIFWGADSVFALGAAHIWIDSVFSGQTEEGWRTFTMDLSDLYRNVATRDSVSALGRPAVYVFWWFKSDADQIRDVGAFIDDVIIAVDDGSLDLRADAIEVRDAEGNGFPSRIETGDYIRARVLWSTCSGGTPFYPDFHATLYMDGNIVYDSLMTGVEQDSSFNWLSDSIEVVTEGEHTFEFVIDPIGEVAEANENNNTRSIPFTSYVPNVPPSFVWITPSTDTLEAFGGVANLSWQLSDPDGDATVTIHIDADNEGCVGPIVPRTLNRPETDQPDTVAWSTLSLPDGALRYLYAEFGDEFMTYCDYSPFPVRVHGLGAGENPNIPSSFSLNQNYPNPFNPETNIDFSITRGGHTTLTIFDITGREITKLIDNDLTPGNYETNFNAGINRPSGVYLYRLDAPEGSITKKMILMK